MQYIDFFKVQIVANQKGVCLQTLSSWALLGLSQHIFTLEKNYFIEYTLFDFITNFRSACRECWVLHCTAAHR